MNDLKQRLYPTGFRPIRYSPPLFNEANLNPHYWPFRGIVWSFVVHASIFTTLVSIPAYFGDAQRPRLRDQAVIVDADELKDVLYLPLLGSASHSKPDSSNDHAKPKKSSAPAREGLSYPGPQPILSEFPDPTNHSQTVLQPALHNPPTLELPLNLPNLVRLAAPIAEPKLAVPEASAPQTRKAEPVTTPLETSLSAPARPLAAPLVESKFKLPDAVSPSARTASQVPLTASDVNLSAPARPLAAPLAESRFRIPDAVNPVARPVLPVPAGQTDITLSSPARALAAPLAESKFKLPDWTTPALPGTARPMAPLDVSVSGPARPLAAPLAASKMNVPDSIAPGARQNLSAAATSALDAAVSGPARPLAAPLAESRMKVPDSSTPAARLATTTTPLDTPVMNPVPPLGPPAPPKPEPTQNVLALSPTPARRDQPAVIPPGEARGQFAISPQPNLSFPGTEPGVKAGSSSDAPGGTAGGASAVAALITSPAPGANSNAGTTTSAASSTNSRPGPGRDVFPGITILGGIEDSGRNSSGPNVSQTGTNPPPLQTSYGITILSSGGSGGGLPDFGVFGNDQVQTVYLDMRRTVQDAPVSWTAEYGIAQAGPSTNGRIAVVGGQQEVLLPFPITKERPTLPAELVRKYAGRMVIAYAVISVDGKMEQLAIKESPDPLLNDTILGALKKWTFRPARRNGEIVSAKVLLGIPLRTD